MSELKKDKITISDLFAYIIVIELVLGGSGHLITIGSFLTIRYILFALAILYYGMKVVSTNFKINSNIFYVHVFLFFSICAVAIINGILKGYLLGNIITSSQGYLYLLMIFPYTLFMQDIEMSKKIIRVFNHSVVLLAILSITIFFVFWIDPSTFDLISGLLTRFDYGYLSMRSELPAIFLKTSPYIAITLIYEIFGYINFKEQRKLIKLIRIAILALGCMSTMSMAIWTSVVVGIGFILLMTPGRKKALTVIALAIFGIILVTIFSGYIIPVIHNRISTDDSSYIIKANQLQTLLGIWKNNSFLGNGFGIEVLFKTEMGTRIMSNFELFWIQLLVNVGLLGFVIYMVIIFKSIFGGLRLSKMKNKEDSVHIKAMVVGLIVLCVISTANPFLNNPIGLGYLVLVMCTINVYTQQYLKKDSLQNREHL